MLKLPIKDYIIIGSYALGVRPASDIDVVCYEADVQTEYKRKDDYSGSFVHNGMRIELLFADKQDSFKFILSRKPYRAIYNNVADPLTLFAIKAGHIMFPSRQWEKHIMDYHILKGMTDGLFNYCTISTDTPHPVEGHLRYFTMQEMIDLHHKSTEDRIGKQRLPKLKNVSKAQFFDDKVVKYYDHDDIHQWFAHKEKPMYTYMQPDPSKVYCCPHLWGNFTHEEMLQCIMEECYVIASERHLIPKLKGSKLPTFEAPMAFKWALMRVCTTLCSGWFRQFAIDSYFDVLNNHNRNYSDILLKHM